MYIDSHCHIHLAEFDADRAQVFDRAHQVDVHYFIVVGNDHESNQRGFRLLKDRDDCFFAMGIHPHHVQEWSQAVKEWLEMVLMHKQVKAVGEAGLDYYQNPHPKALQEEVFRAQIELALRHNKPIVLHIRDAFADAYQILKDYPNLRFVTHCFTGTAEDVDWIVKLGGYISLSGIVTFTNAKQLQEIVTSIPKERLLWETDSPFLAPGKYRGRRCEPAFIVETAQKIADLYQVPLAQLAPQVWENTKTVFDCANISTPLTMS